MNEVIEKLNQILVTQEKHSTLLSSQSQRLEKVEKTLEVQNATLLRNTVTVEQHEQRSTKLENWFKTFLERDFKPVETFMNNIKGMGIFISKAGVVVGILYTVYKFMTGQ